MIEEIKNWSGVVALVILAIFILSSGGAKLLGGVTNYDELDATAIKIGGSSGSRVGPIITGTCSLIASPSFTVGSSTQAAMDCAVTGVVSGDTVLMWFATSTAASQGWSIAGSSASSTSGFITGRIVNSTGASNVLPASLASSTQYLIIHPRTSVPGL